MFREYLNETENVESGVLINTQCYELAAKLANVTSSLIKLIREVRGAQRCDRHRARSNALLESVIFFAQRVIVLD